MTNPCHSTDADAREGTEQVSSSAAAGGSIVIGSGIPASGVAVSISSPSTLSQSSHFTAQTSPIALETTLSTTPIVLSTTIVTSLQNTVIFATPSFPGGAPSYNNTTFTSPLPNDSELESPHHSSLPWILASVFGALGATALTVLAIQYYRRRVRDTKSTNAQVLAIAASKKLSPRDSYQELSSTTPSPAASTDTFDMIASMLPGTGQRVSQVTSARQSTMTAGREEQLRDELKRLRSEMEAVRAGRPPPMLPDYDEAGADVLIFRA